MMMPYASSCSTTVSQQRYDVFMSFRGEDTRTGFTSHLYKDLTQKGITTYKDDKTLEIGRPIAPELLQAIETSRVAIVVLSNNFATSKWCLEEIAKIADCMKQGKLIVIPVFYHVFPTDVRHQSNCFEQGFADHEANPEIAPQKVETWRAAFKEVGAVSGVHVTQHRDEAEVVSELVRKILKDLPDTMPIDLLSSLVGIVSRVNEVRRILRMESSEVLFIGICGMSGIGKTTLAEAVYKDIESKFDKSCLIENIKDISKQNDSDTLCKLQQKLLDDILMEKSIRVKNVSHGQTLLGSKLQALKVIIVLDDVNNVDQLTYLAGRHEWFGPGSRIIITTTKIDLLNPHKIKDIYLCEEMNGDEALRLFCQSAFEQNYPTHGYEKLSEDIVKLAGGLPLALNVYGTQLCGKNKDYWNDMLKQLKEYPEKKVLERLEVVYASLDENQRHVFIYIACFLKGRHIDLVKDILTNIGLRSNIGITDLINKCLITINLEDNVWMHDLIQQMCWAVHRKKSKKYDRKLIAIKSHEEIAYTLSSNLKRTQTVEVINLEPYYKGEANDCFIFDPTCFLQMTLLKFLRISNVDFPQGLNYLSNDLRILEWYRCSLESLPSKFEPKHIYELEMCSSQLKTLWKKDLELPNLRSINLSFSKNLTDLPNLTPASNLVKLKLEGCTSLTSLHASVLLHKRLRYLNLKGCTCLVSLGRSCMEMESLEALLLSECSKLEHIPEFGKNMKCLEHLYVDGTGIKKLPENLGKMLHLRNIDASRTSVEELPISIHLLGKLRLLHVNGCRMLSFEMGCFLNLSFDTLSSGLKEVDLSYCNLTVVPDGIGLLCHIISLDLSGNEFVSLPASIVLLSKLRMLCLNDCKRLRSLPKLSLVDEDMDYGPRSRFNYYVSAKGVDLSKFHSSCFNNHPTVSCLNCPKLAVDKRSDNLAEKLLNNYIELRMKYWMTPEAVFEIVGAGSEIPSGFVQPSSEGLILADPWVGVAICAVISHHIDVYTKANHMVTAHIRLGENEWKISVPINFMVAEAETQLVFYWTKVDDLYRIVGSRWTIETHKFDVSFSVSPADTTLHVTKFGVRFIHKEYITRLKQHKFSLSRMLDFAMQRFVNSSKVFEQCIATCEDDAYLHHHTHNIVKFLFKTKVHYSLEDVYQTTKGLLGINEEYFGYLKDYGIYSYYVINVGASVLYNDFIQSVKDMNDVWLSIKLALEQIVLKSRGDNYSYKEMLQHLNDIEAPCSVRFSDKFITLFFSAVVEMFRLLYIITMETFERGKVMAKICSIPISGVMCMMNVFIGDVERWKLEMEIMSITPMNRSLIRLWKRLLKAYTNKKLIPTEKYYNCELQISDFNYNGGVLQDLMNKMGRCSGFTNENKEEMMGVIDKLQNNIDKVSHAIQDMSTHARQYTCDLEEAKKHVKSFSMLSKDDDIISMLPLFNKN
ncbi:hypothetical protein QVD17_39316 [Tagetes erecta]|uniref:ADP-ribosyl cyclase/cyclic ADP-ribose hydrolase n=1 Tax=Tagetes erecta TaxID=13708 RepID=A0AAD8JNB8_TARER|nr:hypothetical protein QVD17_39316 [Tagetes erecta]